MSANNEIIKQQLEIMINDFFINKLINKGYKSDDISLNDYLKIQISHLEDTLGISFQEKEIQSAFLDLCEKLNLLNKISSVQDISKQIAIDIVENKIIIDKETCDNLCENITKAYVNGFDINQLYKPILFSDKYATIKKLLNEDIFKYLNTTNKWQEKEAIGTINTFLEAAEYTQDDIQKLFKKSQNNRDFVKNLAIEINKSSLISSPFTIDRSNITFMGKGGGLYDFFMYSEKSKKFALNFSTRSKGTKIDGESIFRHTLSSLSILSEYSNNSILNKKNLKKTDKIFEHLYDVFAHYSTPKSYSEGAGSIIKSEMYKKNGIKKFKYQDQCIKGINKRLPLALSETMKKINPSCIDEKDANYSDNKEIHTLAKELNNNMVNTINLNKGDIEKLINSIKFDFEIFYFGEVSSSRNDSNLSDKFTNEELRAGLNILAYSGKNISGFGGVRLEANATITLLEKINYRFNTSTISNDNCLDIDKLNSNIRNIGGIFIKNFMLNRNPVLLINEIYEKESNQVLENMAFFEKNILQQIIDGITKHNHSPEQSYALTLGEFNLKPTLSFVQFIDNLSEKWDLLSDEKIDNGNSLMIKHLSSLVVSRELSLKNTEMILKMHEQMGLYLDKLVKKGFTEEDIIKDNDFTSEILINRFGLKNVKQYRKINQVILDNYEVLYPNSNIATKN